MPNYKFTVNEKIAMLKQRYEGMSYRKISENFAGIYPDRPIPTHATIRYIITRFEENGTVDGKLLKVVQLNKRLTLDTKLSIILSVEEDPTRPASQIAQEVGVSKTSVVNALHEAKYKAFKIEAHQELLPGDPHRRMLFCEQMMNLFDTNPGIRVCYSDESTMFLVGSPNRQNARIWSRNNPHVFVQTGTQYPVKVNVWVGMVGDQIVGPFFIEENLNGERYLRLLREQIVPAIREIEGDGPRVYFQQDGAPAHFTLAVRQYLDEEFPGRWIGRGSDTIEWPARSPDLSPLDYALWAYIKNKLYSHERIADRAGLQARIVEIIQSMSPEHVSNITGAFYDRLGYCTVMYGAHFEHRIRGVLA